MQPLFEMTALVGVQRQAAQAHFSLRKAERKNRSEKEEMNRAFSASASAIHESWGAAPSSL